MLCLEPADHQLVKELLNKAVEVERIDRCVRETVVSGVIDAEVLALHQQVRACTQAAAPARGLSTADASAMELEHMRGLLAAAMDKMPGLRARLEQAEQRLGRVVHVVEGDQARPSPRTVEKLLRGQPSCGEQLKPGWY
ncbi:hypothetical protein QJQ45_001483 [Haematococcus lacustris]|nr:hypothetical protein QJQ45_001483 [Haematococcus lacustris]